MVKTYRFLKLVSAFDQCLEESPVSRANLKDNLLGREGEQALNLVNICISGLDIAPR
jgi:hypothetical protein